jgi:hypothetical protein
VSWQWGPALGSVLRGRFCCDRAPAVQFFGGAVGVGGIVGNSAQQDLHLRRSTDAGSDVPRRLRFVSDTRLLAAWSRARMAAEVLPIRQGGQPGAELVLWHAATALCCWLAGHVAVKG